MILIDFLRKTKVYLFLLLTLFFMVSCETIGTNELSSSEKKALIERCRYYVHHVIFKKKNPLTPRDMLCIDRSEPKMKFEYEGYKKGYFMAEWEINPVFSVLVSGTGDLTDPMLRYDLSLKKISGTKKKIEW